MIQFRILGHGFIIKKGAWGIRPIYARAPYKYWCSHYLFLPGVVFGVTIYTKTYNKLPGNVRLAIIQKERFKLEQERRANNGTGT